MTSTISNQDDNSPTIKEQFKRDGQPKKKTDAGAFIIWLKQNLVSFTGSKGKDGRPQKTPGAGTPFWGTLKKPGRPRRTYDGGTRFWKGIWSPVKKVESSQGTDDVETSTQAQQEKSEHPRTSLWRETNKDGRPGTTDHGGTP